MTTLKQISRAAITTCHLGFIIKNVVDLTYLFEFSLFYKEDQIDT